MILSGLGVERRSTFESIGICGSAQSQQTHGGILSGLGHTLCSPTPVPRHICIPSKSQSDSWSLLEFVRFGTNGHQACPQLLEFVGFGLLPSAGALGVRAMQLSYVGFIDLLDFPSSLQNAASVRFCRRDLTTWETLPISLLPAVCGGLPITPIRSVRNNT